MSVCYKSVKGGRVEGKMYKWVYGMCVYVCVCECTCLWREGICQCAIRV